MKAAVAALACLSVLLAAGCASPGPAAGPADAAGAGPDEADAPVAVAVTGSAATEGNATNVTLSPILEVKASGPAGSWIAVHAPFEAVRDSVGYAFDVEIIASAQEDGLGAFYWPLGTTTPGEEDGSWSLRRANPFVNRLATFQADQQTIRDSGGMGVGSSAGIEGLFFAFGAESPWTLSVRAELGDEDGNLLPATVVQGTGAAFAHGSELLVPAPGGGPANQASFGATVPGVGWSHLEVLRQRLQPTGVSQVALSLPSYSEEGLGVQQGHYVPVLVGGSASGGHLDYIGSPADAAGEAQAEVTYARGDLSIDFGFVHLPLDPASLPGFEPSPYSGSTWPFEDLPTPP